MEQGWQACEETYSTAVTCTTTGPDAVLNSIPLAAELYRGHKETQVTAGELLHSSREWWCLDEKRDHVGGGTDFWTDLEG